MRDGLAGGVAFFEELHGGVGLVSTEEAAGGVESGVVFGDAGLELGFLEDGAAKNRGGDEGCCVGGEREFEMGLGGWTGGTRRGGGRNLNSGRRGLEGSAVVLILVGRTMVA